MGLVKSERSYESAAPAASDSVVEAAAPPPRRGEGPAIRRAPRAIGTTRREEEHAPHTPRSVLSQPAAGIGDSLPTASLRRESGSSSGGADSTSMGSHSSPIPPQAMRTSGPSLTSRLTGTSYVGGGSQAMSHVSYGGSSTLDRHSGYAGMPAVHSGSGDIGRSEADTDGEQSMQSDLELVRRARKSARARLRTGRDRGYVAQDEAGADYDQR